MTIREEQGITLVELVVSMFVLGVVMAGLVSLTMSSLEVTIINRDRTVGSNLAQAELERLRALDFGELVGMVGSAQTVTSSGGLDYTVRTDVSWSSLDADTDACGETAGSTETAVLRADVSVWAGREDDPSGQVTRSSTQIARPPTAPSPDRGAVAVRVFDHQVPPTGTAMVLVRVVGPHPSLATRSATTPTTGCVLFTDLAVGDYEVVLSRPQHVTDRPGPDAAAPARPVSVTENTRSSVEIPYAPAATAAPTVVADGGVSGEVHLPSGGPVSLGRDGRVTVGSAGTEIGQLFPGRWETWFGDCPEADPGGLAGDGTARWPGAVRQDPVVLPPSRTTAVAALAPVARVTLQPPPGSAGHPAPVTLTVTSTSACEGGTRVLTFPGSFVPGGMPVEVGLPFGTWDLVFTGADGTATAQVTLDPTRSGPFTPTGATRWTRS